MTEVKSSLSCMFRIVINALLPSWGGNPPLRSSASTTVYVNLLDLNDNDPTFLNLPFIAEVPEGLPIDSSVFRVGLGFLLCMLNVAKKNHTHNMFHASICIFLCLLTKRTQNNRACCQVCTTFKVQPEIVDCYQALRVLAIQVQVQDPDEAENGAVTLVVQMGFPRLDFRLNSSTGVLFSTAVLDRERIAQYQLRLVAFDAGQFPRTSTSTLTITGTIQSGWHGWRGHFQLQHCSLV